jgi:flavin reductase (DIM6/NTAB) family NADH-FMN oxidoreductase RutF
LAYEQSEFDFSGLTPAPAQFVKAPLVRESPVNIECRVRDIVAIGSGPGSANVVFGNIVALHVADWLLNDDGLIDPHKLRTIGRLGGTEYVTVSDPYTLLIPDALPPSIRLDRPERSG